jgi:hypothetical protein
MPMGVIFRSAFTGPGFVAKGGLAGPGFPPQSILSRVPRTDVARIFLGCCQTIT